MNSTSLQPESTTGTLLVVRRTPWDVIFGLLAVVASFFLFGNVLFATTLSVWIFAWTTLFTGIVLVIGALLRIKSGGFWSAALGGAIMIVVGVFIMRNPLIGAATLTLLVGAMFFAAGLARLVGAAQAGAGRWVLVLSGLISVGLGIWVLFNITAATATLLGTILAIQMLIEGLSMMTVGRLRLPKAA